MNWKYAICFGVTAFGVVGHPCAAAPPNIVLILADDMGYGDPTCYNAASKIPTPNIDRIAKRGVRFKDAHTPSSVCTPTRYTLLTGRYCWRTRLKSSVLDGFSPPLIDPEQPTIASLLKQHGYATACIGKWHLGMQWTRKDGSLEDQDRWSQRGFRPGDNIDFSVPVTAGPLTAGFDSFFGISASLDMPPYCWMENDRCSPSPDSTVPTARDTIFLNQSGGAAASSFSLDGVLPELKARATDWIASHHQDSANQPFFLYLPLNSPHLPVAPSEAFRGKSQVGFYGDFVMETDNLVGAVLDELRKHGLEQNTIVIFTSDNGGLWHQWQPQELDDLAHYKPTARAQYTMQFGHQSNAHLRGTKADVWEGGHRVPFLLQWPKRIAGDRVAETPIELTDLFATILELFDEKTSGSLAPDSFSLLPILDDDDATKFARPYLVHHSLNGVFAVRRGDWKYVESRGSGGFSQPRQVTVNDAEPVGQLYNLADDPSETRNLFASERERVVELQDLLNRIKGTTRLPDR